MSANQGNSLYDPEFDTDPGARVRLRVFDPVDHRRVVVNPWLAVAAVTAWGWLLDALIKGLYPILSLAWLLVLIFMPAMVQYHCLDCGKTGRYFRRQRHACPGVLARSVARQPSRTWVPSGEFQVKVWTFVIATITILAWVWSFSERD